MYILSIKQGIIGWEWCIETEGVTGSKSGYSTPLDAAIDAQHELLQLVRWDSKAAQPLR